MNNQEREEKGITLVALVITIIVLIILAGIAISMTLGDNGIFTRAKEAKRLQITAEAIEKIGADILDAQIEAVQKNETLQQSKVEEIISKYGELQADGDTIKLKDNGYEISLKEIYNGTTSSSGGSTGGSTGSAELNSLKAELAQTTATEDKILKDYKAYSNGKLMTGTMANYAGKTVTASTITENGENAEITIPEAGYYGTDSKVSIPVETIKDNIGTISSNLGVKNILNDITFQTSNYKYINTSWDFTTGVISKNNEGVSLTLPNYGTYYYSKEKIQTSKINRLYIIGTVNVNSSYASSVIGLSNEQQAMDTNWKVLARWVSETGTYDNKKVVAVLDCSAITDDLYLVLGEYYCGGKCTIERIFVEYN